MSSDRSRGGQSDSPPRDLQREREQFLQNFTKGGRLSEEFVAELERVRTRLEELEAENAKLRAQVETDLAVRELLDKIQHLESEKSELLSRTHKAEAVSTEFSERFEEVESEFANLANLFVASNQLHASLSPRGVMRRIKEVLAQLVGAERYCVYLADRDQEQLVPVASEGLRADELVNQPLAEGPLGKVFSSGEAGVDETDPSRGVIERPAAVVPLSVDEQVVGLIAIFSTL
ncbi:MAG TPA: GAF domain-containing protein, partial [Polyangiaceae bacterium]|nr:GAF domain-containing protein [Polyangiaceae bacterium]